MMTWNKEIVFGWMITFHILLSSNAEIQLRQGIVNGVPVQSKNGPINAYLGIPYAKPPVESLRFKIPEPHGGWEGSLNASSFRPACPQPFLRGVRISEDCLYLNIWTPSNMRNPGQYPVVVLIEGEMFLTSASVRFPGEDLAAEDLIVVTISYRTNAFGFLSWEDEHLPGNIGLQDQILALKWVRENIERFGADVSKITLLGHSAGGASVSFHLTSSKTHSLFTRAVIISGSSFSPWAISRNPKAATRKLAMELNCNLFLSGSGHLAECLRRRDMNDIVTTVRKMVEVGVFMEGNPFYLFGPSIDSFLPPDQRLVHEPVQGIRENMARNIPVIAGFSEDDGSVMLYLKREIMNMNSDDLRRYNREILIPMITSLVVAHKFPSEGTASFAINRIIQYKYIDEAPNQRFDLIQQTSKMFSDAFFKTGMTDFVEVASSAGIQVYLYVNNFQGQDFYNPSFNSTGAHHGSDLAYLFAPASFKLFKKRTLSFDEQNYSQKLQKIVYSFSHSGSPTLGVYSPRWKPYTLESPSYLMLDSLTFVNEFEKHKLNFWRTLLPSLHQIGIQVKTTTSRTTSYPELITSPPSNRPMIITGSSKDEVVTYQSALWVLGTVVVILIAVIIAYIVCSKRRRQVHSTANIGPDS